MLKRITTTRPHLCHCLRFLVLAFLVGTSSTSCVPVDYRPNERVVQALGLPEAQQRLRETLLRSVNPQVIDVRVTTDGLAYQYKTIIRTGWGIPVGWTDVQEKLIAFTNVSKVDVFENHTVYVRGAGGQVIAVIVCASDQAAKAFADLLMSLRTQYLSERGSLQRAATSPVIGTTAEYVTVITPEVVQRIMAANEQAMRNKDTVELMRFFATDAVIEITVISPANSTTLRFNTEEYRQHLRKGFSATGSDYRLQHTITGIQINPNGKSALVSSEVVEETVVQGQRIRSQSTGTTHFELVDRKPLITGIKASVHIE